MTGSLVEVQDLTKTYTPSPLWMRALVRSAIEKPVTALESMSFTVEAGTICAIVGPNGAGKSTLFRVLTGLTKPTAGSAKVCGLDATRDSAVVRRLIGFMPAEDRSLFLRFNCEENLLFHGRLHGIPERQLRCRIGEVVEKIGLSHACKRAGFALSSGMRARLQLARALLHEPLLLILDEPTATVDPLAAYEFLEILQKITAEKNVGVLISSHRLEEIEALHQNVILLDRGKLVYKGDLESLRQLWEKPRIQINFSSEAAAVRSAEVLSAAGFELVSVEPRSLMLAPGVKIATMMRLIEEISDHISSVAESKMPLRELLAAILSQDVRKNCAATSTRAGSL